MKTKTVQPSQRTLEIRKAITDTLQAELKKGDIPSDHVVAILAHLTGQAMALMDQRIYTPADAIFLVQTNIETGNAEIVAQLRDGKPAGFA